MTDLDKTIKSAIIGLAVGDALGVPAEFRSYESMKASPITEMVGYGTHNQPPGTWSDDSSLTFCLMESLCNGFDLKNIGQKFQDWLYQQFWTPHGEVFDIGHTTITAIKKLRKGFAPHLCGGMRESSNGNGSLMRILPLAFYLKNHPISNRYETTKLVSSITHGHFRSVLACFIYIEYVLLLLEHQDTRKAYEQMQVVINNFIATQTWNPKEVALFDRVLVHDIANLPEEKIAGSGYVLHSLEASLWCLLNSSSYKETVLKAVNLGEDTDTTAAIAGGIAGIAFGYDDIPEFWIAQLARLEDILDLCERFTQAMEIAN